MENKNITDYSVRVWDDDVYIHGRGVNYLENQKGVGMQCNFDVQSLKYAEILAVCRDIRKKFLLLNELTK